MRPHDSMSPGRFRLRPGRGKMSLFREEPKDRSVQTGLVSVFAMVVLVATVNFYRFFRYFPA